MPALIQRPANLFEPTSRHGLSRLPWAKLPGIYQLWVGDKTYIGKARNLQQRLKAAHPYADDAQRIRILSLFERHVSDKELLNTETYWIQLLRPELNALYKPFIR